MGRAISSGMAALRSRVAWVFMLSSSGLIVCFTAGVRVKPGIMQVTRTLYGQYSPAKVFVRLLMADFKGPYKVLRPAEGQRAARELTLTMAPECCFFI